MPSRAKTWRERVARETRVHLSFLRVVLPQFRLSIGLFLVVNLLGATVIWAEARPELTFPHALYVALGLNLFEVEQGYPQDGPLLIQAVYFLIPAIGLTVIAEGLVRFGVAIVNRKTMNEEWQVALAHSFEGHVVIAGMGRIGRRVAERLCQSERVVCIEKEGQGSSPVPDGVAVVHGDATQAEVLERANVARARAILALTDNDLVNLEVALNAREVNPKLRVVLRMFNERLGQRLVQQFGFDAVYSTSALAAPSFAAALYSSHILRTIEVDENKTLHLARVSVAARSCLVGLAILELERRADVSVVLHRSKGKQDLLPSADTRVQAGDELFVLAELEHVDSFDRLATGESSYDLGPPVTAG